MFGKGERSRRYLIALDFVDLLVYLTVGSNIRLVQGLSSFGVTGSTDGEREARCDRWPSPCLLHLGGMRSSTTLMWAWALSRKRQGDVGGRCRPRLGSLMEPSTANRQLIKCYPVVPRRVCPFFSPTDHTLYSYILSRHTMIASFNVLLRMQDKYVLAPGDLCST